MRRRWLVLSYVTMYSVPVLRPFKSGEKGQVLGGIVNHCWKIQLDI